MISEEKLLTIFANPKAWVSELDMRVRMMISFLPPPLNNRNIYIYCGKT